MAILAIETSCDETAAAVIGVDGRLRASVVRTQEQLHGDFGGIVPEIASRAHCAYMQPVIDKALQDAGMGLRQLQAVAVTAGPGLLGSLLVGLSTAKALALGLSVPLIGVDHLEAHIAAAFIENPEHDFSSGPLLALVVSGGHTALYMVPGFGHLQLLGHTQDDAVGEAYDKVASLLKLGYPGGPIVDKLAQSYQGALLDLPIPMQHVDDLQFSFSGLKTAVLQMVRRPQPPEASLVAASFQHAAVQALLAKLEQAVERYPQIRKLVVCGGVACNSGLRRALAIQPWLQGREVLIPVPQFCTDNAAMIARLGLHYFRQQQFSALDLAPYTAASDSPVLAA